MGYREEAAQVVASRGQVGESARLRCLFDLDWKHGLEEYPELATYAGEPRYNDRWTDWSLDAVERRKAELEIPAGVLASIDPDQLDSADRLHYELFKRSVEEGIEGRRFRGEYMPITQMQGLQQDTARLLAMMPTATLRDFEDRIARLKGIPALVEQTLTLLRKGMEEGLTPPRVTLRDVPQQIQNQIAARPFESPLLASFARLPESVPSAAAASLRDEAARVYLHDVAPAFERLHAFFARDYLPRTRESIALSDLPDGEAWYAFAVRQFTTTRLTPREIHEIGLREVARIRQEMEETIAEVGSPGGFAGFVAFLRTDPRFFFDQPEDLLVAYRDICKRADPELARLFGRLPRLPYGVLPVPGYAERSQTAAYYEPGSPQAGRPGYFFANTYDLKARPRWEMEALALHEAVPGHHLQLALAQELADMPEFRKHAFYTAFIEGWGLYAESLGREMGFYVDPYSRFGRLTYEMWRAVRLVVDTGIHSFGWSRDRAISYFEENAGKAHHDVVVEVDRYIVWPAQALAYKIGELKIKELRALAAAARGQAFDLRAFHDLVLGNGALPLDVLEEEVKGWLRGLETGFAIRKATLDDRTAIEALIVESARGLSREDYSEEQIEAAIASVFGVDTALIHDGTYFVAEASGTLVGCGGWSRRRTLFGGDRYADRDAGELDPLSEAAKIRAFFVHPDWARKGIGTAILAMCESEARAHGFRSLELMATLPGVRLYAALGYQGQERVEYEIADGTRIEFVPMRKDLRVS